MIARRWLLLAALLIPFGEASHAQDAPQQCELHIWPSEGLSTVLQRVSDNLDTHYMGVLSTSPRAQITFNTAPIHTKPASPGAGPLSTSDQAALLTRLPLAADLGIPDYRIIVHDVPLDSRTIRTVKTRYSASTAPCYADLVIDDVVYSREYAHGQNLKTFFRFRDFKMQATPARSFATWVQTKLATPMDPPDQSAAASTEAVSAFQANIALFSRLLSLR